VIPEANVWTQPESIDPDLAAIFDPLGNAVHTALTFPLVGEDVLISGAGPIGLMAAKVARHIGARFIVITDVNESRLELARRMGVDRAINVTTSDLAAVQKELGMKEGFDIAFEMSGNQKALPLLLDNLGHGARIAMLGLPSTPIAIDWAKVVSHMITIKGIYGREMFETWYAMNAMVATGLDISEVITDRFAAADWELAFATARSGNGGKVIMNWSD
jgi:threonine 3-dehydrogenase